MPDTDEQQILPVLLQQEAAAARGDAAGVVAQLSEDVVTYDLPPALEYRDDAARDEDGLDLRPHGKS